MPDPYLLAAAAVALLTCALHVVLGGAKIAAPLLHARDLRPVPKYTHYYCWHMVTIVLVAMPVCFALAAYRPQSAELAVLMTVLAGCFAVWGLLLVLGTRQKLHLMPQWALFAAIAACGAAGCLA